MRLVLVITGKSGVLRRQVPLWLATVEFRALVISAESAAIRHGGDGALYVRVRRAR
jgi:DNA-nicking Smr family endonuclease